ncbi:hypothetical protein BH10BDE1_BH10BDE1_01490 [soil metagenome]
MLKLASGSMSVLSLSTLAFVAAVATLAVILGTQVYFSRLRRRRFHTLELVPNILMTRYPLLFVGRSRSVFRIAGDFLELPVYLQEHGYQVEEVEILEKRVRRESLVQILTTTKAPVHLIVGEALSEIAYDLAIDGHPKLASLTLLGRTPNRDRHVSLRPSKSPIFERPELRPLMNSNSFRTEENALQHMVSLAELDLR